jgi:hypothetical protein
MIELPPPLSLEAALRAVGQDLDGRGIAYAEVRLAPLGITVETTQPYARNDYSWGNLGIRLRSPADQRVLQEAQGAWFDLSALTRWAVLLAVIGQILDRRQRVRGYLIEAEVATADAPTECQVRVSVAGEPILGTEEVQEQLLRLRARGLVPPPPPPPPPRPWWAFWQRKPPSP